MVGSRDFPRTPSENAHRPHDIGVERDFHALRTIERGSRAGPSIKDYTIATGRPERFVNREVAAARVASASPSLAKYLDKVVHLAEIDAAPKWLWPVRVAGVVDDRDHACRGGQLADLSEAPPWADHEHLAAELVAGEAKPADMRRLADVAVQAERELERLGVDVERFKRDLAMILHRAQPTMVSVVIGGHSPGPGCGGCGVPRQAARLRKSVLLDQWYKVDAARDELLSCEAGRRGFNRQKTADIEWAMHSWNPVTGCRHDCPY
jgi:hypothetical protein